jgi:hypothetical protein
VSFTPSLVRQALDELLRAYPMFDLVSVDWQIDPQTRDWRGPWVRVGLGQPGEGDVPAWAVHSFAIWRTTGAIHGVWADGSVTDDVLFVAPYRG